MQLESSEVMLPKFCFGPIPIRDCTIHLTISVGEAPG
jgi:hypothetical protein